MSIVLQGSTSGSITLQEPAVAGSNTINLPAATGTAVLTGVSGNVDINAAGSNNVTLSTNSTERMRITSGGNVGIGTSSPAGRLDVRSTYVSDTTVQVRFGDNTGGFLDFGGTAGANKWINASDGSTTAYPLAFQTGGTERMRITSDGNVLVNGTSSQGSTVKMQAFSNAGNGGSGYIGMYASGSSLANQQVGYQVGQTNLLMYAAWDGSGNARNNLYCQAVSQGVQLSNGGTSWSAISDIRQKDIIEPITDAANKLSNLRAVIGKYKNDEEGKRRSFLIAQDVQAVLPEAVTIEDEGQDTEKLLLSYTDVIPLLVASIKELKGIVDTQAIKIADLEAKLEGTV